MHEPAFHVPIWAALKKGSSEGFRKVRVGNDVYYEKYSPSEQWSHYSTDNIMARSSAPNEDWLDPRAGVEESKHLRGDKIKAEIEAKLQDGAPLVVQNYVSGIGFVVDIGWSELLEQAVVRIAHGNISKTGSGDVYTSATWDTEARIGLYNTDGESIVPLPERSLFEDIAPNLAKILVGALKKLEIDFGVQLELVIHPDRPDSWQLVQIRPSPEAVRGMQTKPEIKGELLATTGKVSHVGQVEGEAMKFDLRMITHRDAHQGKIATWNNKASIELIEGANHTGIAGHIGSHLIPNSGHGTYRRIEGYWKEELEKVRAQKRLMLGLDYRTNLRLIGRVARENLRLLLVSDGLVGQIYKIG